MKNIITMMALLGGNIGKYIEETKNINFQNKSDWYKKFTTHKSSVKRKKNKRK